MLKICLIFSALLFISCIESHDNDDYLLNELTFIVTDDKGNNLFDPNGAKKINKNSIKLYYLQSNGKKKNYKIPQIHKPLLLNIHQRQAHII